ncbi:MAG: hypothetical protein V2J20_07950 [Wenzhouxiangella sp.]|nr:hypothetical protein [Wenzhouxiangella sp.]
MNRQHVMLVRAQPGSPQADQAFALAQRWDRQSRSGLVFFHGPGLAHGLSDRRSGFAALHSDRVELLVCRAGWRRLQAGPLDPPFAEGSLMQFWSKALRAEEVHSFGALNGL